MRSPRRVWPPPVLDHVVPPELATGADFFHRIVWPSDPRLADVRRIWAQTQLAVWSTAALQLAGRVLLDAARAPLDAGREAAHIGLQIDGTRYPLAPSWLTMLPTPECWWAGPDGFMSMRVRRVDGTVEEPTLTALGLSPSPAGLLLTPIVGVQPWMAAFWPMGRTRAQVLAEWGRQGREMDLMLEDVFSVMTAAVQAGLLARLAGIVATVAVQSGEQQALWTCVPGELPTPDPRIKPS